MFKPLKPVQTVYHIKTTSPLKVVFLDTMFIDDVSLVCVMDLFTKFASVSAFRKPVDSKVTKKALEEFLAKVDSSVDDIGEFRVDGGSEYMGAFREFVGDTKRIVSMAYRKQAMSPVERFNGTMRRFLERMFEVQGKPINWPQKYIPEAVRVYNEELEHGSTGYTPKEALVSEDAQRVIRQAQAQRSPPPDVQVGDTVRALSRDIQNVFDKKIRSNWTRQLFTVKAIKGSKVVLNDGAEVMSHEVLKIDPDLLFEGPQKAPAEAAPRKPKPTSQRALREIQDYLGAPNPQELPARRIPRRR
jgi:hypothetical protein